MVPRMINTTRVSVVVSFWQATTIERGEKKMMANNQVIGAKRTKQNPMCNKPTEYYSWSLWYNWHMCMWSRLRPYFSSIVHPHTIRISNSLDTFHGRTKRHNKNEATQKNATNFVLLLFWFMILTGSVKCRHARTSLIHDPLINSEIRFCYANSEAHLGAHSFSVRKIQKNKTEWTEAHAHWWHGKISFPIRL